MEPCLPQWVLDQVLRCPFGLRAPKVMANAPFAPFGAVPPFLHTQKPVGFHRSLAASLSSWTGHSSWAGPRAGVGESDHTDAKSSWGV